MASSTSIPDTSSIPMRVLELMLMSNIGKKMIAVRKLKGIAITVRAALRKPIVNHSSAITSSMPVTRLSIRTSMRGVTNAAVSMVL